MLMSDDELGYLEEKIKTLMSDIVDAWGHYEWEDDDSYEKGDYKLQVNLLTQTLYNSMMTYFEARGFHSKMAALKAFEEGVKDEKETVIPIEYDYGYSSTLFYLDKFQDLLTGIKAFSASIDNNTPNVLRNILSNTSQIVSFRKTEISNETDIYNAVFPIVRFSYPSTKHSGSAFICSFKKYHPDILIPELKTAVEYKFIRRGQEANISTALDQIHVDAKAYRGDPNYSNFIAVICLEAKEVPEQTILLAWEEFKFPKNWSLIIQFLS